MADLSGVSNRALVEELLNRLNFRELSGMITNIDQSRRTSVHSSRPDSPISTPSLRSHSSLSHRLSGSSVSSAPSIRRICDTGISIASLAAQTPQRIPFVPALGPGSTTCEPDSPPHGYQSYSAALEFPPAGLSDHIRTGCDASVGQLREPSDQPKRLLFCTYCFEQKVQKTVTFKMKSDWKKHEMNFHDTGEEWPCEVPQCSEVFDRGCDFVKHRQREHKGIPYIPNVNIVLPERVAFGCGFKGCKHVSYNWDDRCNHIAKCDFFLAGSEWDYSTRIRNLLRQKSICNEWKRFLTRNCYIYNIDRTTLRWNPKHSRVLRQKLECKDFGPPEALESFFMIAFELGRGPFPAPHTFITPRIQATTDDNTKYDQESPANLVGVDYDSQPPLYSDPYLRQVTEAVPPNDLDMSSSFYPPDDTFANETATFSAATPSDAPNRRVSILMLDVLDEPSDDFWPAPSFLDNIAPLEPTHQTQDVPAWAPEFVNPGQPSHTNPEAYYHHAESVAPARSTPSQRIRNSVRRVKSNLSSKRSQQSQHSITYNHPDLPLGTHSPNASSGSSRSTGGSRVDLGGSARY